MFQTLSAATSDLCERVYSCLILLHPAVAAILMSMGTAIVAANAQLQLRASP